MKNRPPEQRNQKWDDEIIARVITLVDLETNRLSQPRTRFDILNNLDRKTHRLIQLSPDDPEDPNFVPVCKVVSKKESYEQDKRRKQQAKEAKQASGKGSTTKTLELNWAIDGNDLQHRLDRMREFLQEGRKVEIVLASKKKGRKASKEDCAGVLKAIQDAVNGVQGAKETKKMEGPVGGFATMMVQGRPIQVDKTKSEEQLK